MAIELINVDFQSCKNKYTIKIVRIAPRIISKLTAFIEPDINREVSFTMRISILSFTDSDKLFINFFELFATSTVFASEDLDT